MYVQNKFKFISKENFLGFELPFSGRKWKTHIGSTSNCQLQYYKKKNSLHMGDFKQTINRSQTSVQEKR